MASNSYYAVARINGQIAVLADDQGRNVALPLSRLPKGLTAGCVLSIRLDNAGTPAWSSAEIDYEEARRRIEDAERLENELKDRKRSE
jgi:hypothetical protein